ncbi:MAG TPA: VOC family protein [Rhodothermales bacterium]|nr:VOC family protein [Rhodothermales bacterium]
MKATPYLNFHGQCREAFELYAKVLNGKIEAMISLGDSPMAGEVPAEIHHTIMHAHLVADDVELMASDSMGGHYERPAGLYVSLHVESPDEADRIFNAFADGGKVTMPIEETFWAKRFGMVVDRFGTPWMVNCSNDWRPE